MKAITSIFESVLEQDVPAGLAPADGPAEAAGPRGSGWGWGG